jgi:hypothetical protein
VEEGTEKAATGDQIPHLRWSMRRRGEWFPETLVRG